MSIHDQEILEKSKGSPERIRQKMIDREQSIRDSKKKRRFRTAERKSDLVNYDIFDQTAEIKQEMSFEN
jgi:hypothetical protein